VTLEAHIVKEHPTIPVSQPRQPQLNTNKMPDNEPDRGSLLRHEGTDLFDISNAITPPRLPHQRHAYHRMNSQGAVDFAPDRTSKFSGSGVDDEENVFGLGITPKAVSITRVPVGSRSTITSPPTPSKSITPSTGAQNSPRSPPTPGSSTQLLSPAPAWQRFDSGNHTLAGGLSLMEEMDEQDILQNNDDNDNDKKSIFKSLLAFQN
jgi:hypothetical protein